MSDSYFSAELFNDLRKPLLEASTLPSWCYTSEAFFEREKQAIFLKNWQFVCRAEEIAKTGEYFC